MPIVVLLVAVAAIGAVAVILVGRSGRPAEFAPDRPPFVLPEDALHPENIDDVRFAVGARGYRMEQVDLVMDRLASELAERDRRIAELTGGESVTARGERESVVLSSEDLDADPIVASVEDGPRADG